MDESRLRCFVQSSDCFQKVFDFEHTQLSRCPRSQCLQAGRGNRVLQMGVARRPPSHSRCFCSSTLKCLSRGISLVGDCVEQRWSVFWYALRVLLEVSLGWHWTRLNQPYHKNSLHDLDTLLEWRLVA